MDSRALDAHENTQIETGPIRIRCVAVGAIGISNNGRPEWLDGRSVHQTVHPRFGFATLVALQRAENLVLDGSHPFFTLVNTGRFKMPDFIIQRNDLEFIALSI